MVPRENKSKSACIASPAATHTDVTGANYYNPDDKFDAGSSLKLETDSNLAVTCQRAA